MEKTIYRQPYVQVDDDDPTPCGPKKTTDCEPAVGHRPPTPDGAGGPVVALVREPAHMWTARGPRAS